MTDPAIEAAQRAIESYGLLPNHVFYGPDGPMLIEAAREALAPIHVMHDKLMLEFVDSRQKSYANDYEQGVECVLSLLRPLIYGENK